MGLIAKDLPTLVFMLLPGFLAAGVFYTLTAHPKSTEFERLIQALIFTAIVRALTIAARGLMAAIGTVLVLGRWTEDVEWSWAVVLALPVGLTFAHLVNSDKFHRLLRRRGITKRTSYPSEWYGTFAQEKRWVVLHFIDGRRLFGWPEEWPDQPDKGHFVVDQPEWLLDDNRRAPLDPVAVFLIPASDVKMVEFLKADQERSLGPDESERVERLLIDAQKEDGHGSEGTAAGPQSSP
jgi:hypothetical protein